MTDKILLPAGFGCAAVHCGIKKGKIKNGKADLGVIVSDVPATAAAVFTTNRVQAAPIHLTKKHLHNGTLRAVVVNSGNANACTGTTGDTNALGTAELAGCIYGCDTADVAVASTGVIGVPLPMGRLTNGLNDLGRKKLKREVLPFAKAIMTTDTVPKMVCRKIKIAGKTVTVTGTAKGSGMIAPNLATMLGFICTDAKIAAAPLKKALKAAVSDTFNMMTVDGDTSTNDTLLCLANGKAGNTVIKAAGAAYTAFAACLADVCLELTKMLARDGEGATKLVAINVTGAKSVPQAKQVAKAIANSPLVKTAVFGRDPNWGRIMCAAGYSGAPIEPDKAVLHLNGQLLFKNGLPAPFDHAKAVKKLSGKDVVIDLALNQGKSSATAYTCDFSYDYVRINAEYTT